MCKEWVETRILCDEEGGARRVERPRKRWLQEGVADLERMGIGS